MTRLTGFLLVLVVLSACGGGAAPPPRTGPDVVSADWTSGDDAVLPGAATAPPADGAR